MTNPLAADAVVHELTEAGFDNAVRDGMTVIDFWAPWCGPARADDLVAARDRVAA